MIRIRLIIFRVNTKGKRTTNESEHSFTQEIVAAVSFFMEYNDLYISKYYFMILMHNLMLFKNN